MWISDDVLRAAVLHGEFVKIHPFVDGNGRIARLLMNFELMKNGFPPTIIKVTMRPQYYDALDLAHTTGDYAQFAELVLHCAEDSLDLWLGLVGDGKVIICVKADIVLMSAFLLLSVLRFFTHNLEKSESNVLMG